jgi:hypothetical protein
MGATTRLSAETLLGLIVLSARDADHHFGHQESGILADNSNFGGMTIVQN